MNILENDSWKFIEDLNECYREAIERGNIARTRKIDDCATTCRGVSQIFAYGTNDFGGNGCHEGLCKCHCIDELNYDKCKIMNYNDYWFFKFNDKFKNDQNGKQFQT